jgi:hypothetical protein
MAVVTLPERTAAASVAAVPRSLASISRVFAGVLLAVPFSGCRWRGSEQGLHRELNHRPLQRLGRASVG